MSLIAIGDIHGCARTLEALLERLAPAKDDHLVFVGDYIDRGPDSRSVVDRLLDLREEHQCTFLRGNHEALMLDYVDRGAYELWQMNGGVDTLKSYAIEHQKIEIPKDHIDFIRDTELYYDTPDFFFVHAGLRPELTIEENLEKGDEEVFLWERGHFDARDLAWEKPVVCGHTPQSRPIDREKLIAIDTGCVYYMHPRLGRLTAVRLPEREFITIDYEG